MFQDTASALFGTAGLQVIDAEAGPGGVVTVWAVTDHADAAACPDCGTVSGRPHEMVVTRPRDVRRGLDRLDVRWVKRRWKCPDGDCGRKTFTESLPAVPPRCRVTARLRDQAAHEVAERGITPAEAARHAGLSWPPVHDAFAAAADRVLQAPHALLPVYERASGNEHPATLGVRANLARWTGEAGDPAAARDEYNQEEPGSAGSTIHILPAESGAIDPESLSAVRGRRRKGTVLAPRTSSRPVIRRHSVSWSCCGAFWSSCMWGVAG